MTELYKALVEAQKAIKSLPRTKEVSVRTKSGSTYAFRYAPLDAIITHVRKPLTDNGLWFMQSVERVDDLTVLKTFLVHSSGECFSTVVPLSLNQSMTPQEQGSALTYAKRYGLCAILGLVADEDDDGNHASGHTIQSASETAHETPESTPGALYVSDVTSKSGETNGRQWTVYRVSLSDGRTASTFDSDIAAAAADLGDRKAPILVEVKPVPKKGTLELRAIAEIAAEDVPF